MRKLSSEEESDDESRPSPAQEALKKAISVLESQVNSAVLARDSGLADTNIQNKITKLRNELEQKRKELNTKINRARLARKYRSDRKAALYELAQRDPEAGKSLKVNFYLHFLVHVTYI